MHMLGGLVLGFMGLWILIQTRRIERLFIRDILLTVTIFVFVGGIGWELFEYIQDVLLHTSLQLSSRDTISDLIADVFGGFLSLAWYFSKDW
jgi:hypothetical protein